MQKRKLKIYEQSQGTSYTPVPTIIIKGLWLKESGFNAGEYLEVEVEGDKIVLSKTTPPAPKEKSFNQKIEELTPAQKKKLEKLIDEMK